MNCEFKTDIPFWMDRERFEERAAIKEYEGNLPRMEAEKQAIEELTELQYNQDVKKANEYK